MLTAQEQQELKKRIVADILLYVRDLIDVQVIELPPITQYTLSYKGIALGNIQIRPFGEWSIMPHGALVNNYSPNELETNLVRLFTAISDAIVSSFTMAQEGARPGGKDFTQREAAWQTVTEVKEYLVKASRTAATGAGDKGSMREERKRRAYACKELKDAHPEWSYTQVAMKATEKIGEEVTPDDVRNDYRAMGWQWERADRIR